MTTTPSSTRTTKYCPCVLCGATIVATTEDECLAHLQVCSTFHRVHPKGQATNPQAMYTTTKTPTNDQGERETENVHSRNNSSATMALPPLAATAAAAGAIASQENNSNDDDDDDRTMTKATRSAAAAALPSESSRGRGVEVEHLSVAQLRRYIQQAGLAADEGLETRELQQRAHEATVRTSLNPFQ